MDIPAAAGIKFFWLETNKGKDIICTCCIRETCKTSDGSIFISGSIIQ